MSKPVLKLLPEPIEEVALQGLYLNQGIREHSSQLERAFVYSNFIVSLDGRIAIPNPPKEGMMVPDAIANDRDWRLFQELVVQADLLITSGRYLRDYAEGRAQEILRIYENPDFSDLREWRQNQGMPAFPDLAVISNSLDFPLPEELTQGDRKVVIVTSETADPARVEVLKEKLGTVLFAGQSSVEGRQLVRQLTSLGYRSVYSTAGPKILHLLLQGNVLDHLFLTHAHRVLGGTPFSTIVEGPPLSPIVDFHLESLYYDPYGLENIGQLFCSYKR